MLDAQDARCTDRSLVSMISRGCSIAADLLVAGVTWWSAYKTHEFAKGIKFRRRSAGNVILHDGTCYMPPLCPTSIVLSSMSCAGSLYFM